MDKKELVGFIQNDIKELELLAQGMKELDKIPEVMLELAVKKTQILLDRYNSLKKEEEKQESENVLFFGSIDGLNSQLGEKKENEEENIILSEEKDSINSETNQVVDDLIEREENVEIELVSELIEMVSEDEKRDGVEEFQKKKEEREEKGTVLANEKIVVQERTITNEKFKSQIRSINESIPIGKKIESRFVRNLKKAINLNDRYRYQRELFGGNPELMNSVIEKLDTMSSLEEALNYVRKEFTWNTQSDTVLEFYSLLESRFS